MGMETTGLVFKNLKTLWVDPIEYMTELKIAVMYLPRRDINVSIYNLQLCILPQELWRFSKKSISDWKNIILDECLIAMLGKSVVVFLEHLMGSIANIFVVYKLFHRE
jgi:hypothetical protein